MQQPSLLLHFPLICLWHIDHGPPYNQPCSPTHWLWKPMWDLKMEWLIELWHSGLECSINCISDTQKNDIMQWISPLRRYLSNIHSVSFLCCLHHSIPQSYIPSATLHFSVYPLNQKEWIADHSLGLSLNPGRKHDSWPASQAWNVRWH